MSASVSSSTANLLVELFVEELPPKALKKLGEAFASTLASSLQAQGLASAAAAVTPFASPRRLAVHVAGVAAAAADRQVSSKLMPASVGLDASGKPSPALVKKLASLGVSADAVADVLPTLERRMDGKAEALFYNSTAAGVLLEAGLQKALDEAIARLPIPKLMGYQLADGWTTVHFVRPAHGLVALHGDAVVTVKALGLQAGRDTHGHRFEATVDPVRLAHADRYAEQLASEGAVIASFEARRAEIERQLQAAAAKEGAQPVDDAALLDEVTGLVERPNVLVCGFEPQFLEVPQECLILTMKANQKYFPLLDAAGKLSHRFLVVSNIAPDDASRVVEGNERVVRPRLADAKFFFDQDRRKTLESRVPGLSKVVYHNKLGTQGERLERVRAISRAIAGLWKPQDAALAATADKAALLAKADLVTDMVGEFPELQGIMGGYYARHDGLGEDVAVAIEDHYKPRFAGDELARNDAGIVVALADKLETLVGLFGVGQLPTGDRDPFALRRHALGVVRMLVEKALPLDLGALLAVAVPSFGDKITDPSVPLAEFIYERLSGSLKEQGYSAQEVDAVLALRPQRLSDIGQRLLAVRAFAALPEATALAAANKRVGNILRKVDGGVDAKVDASLLHEAAEVELWRALSAIEPTAEATFREGRYTDSLVSLAALRAPVDAFFDGVMVNAEDPALRANRLGLLARLHAAMNRVADLSRLAT